MMYKVIYLVVLGVIGSISLSSSYGIKRYPSNLMLDFNWPEPDEHIMKFPHEKYCHYYYKRESEELFTIRKCPAGEMFDYHVHECKDKHSAQCWSHHYGKHAVHDHIHSKWRKHFKCPFPNGNYPDIFDCNKYMVCLDGTPHNKHCPPNQQFDKNRRHCVYAAVCANSSDAALVTHMCPYPSGNFAHLEDCSKYYKCHRSEPTVKMCEENKLFDEEDRECKDKELVHCIDRPNPYNKTSASELTVKSGTADAPHPTVSSEKIDTNTNTQALGPNKQSKSTNSLAPSTSSKIIDKTSVTKDQATAESIGQSGKTGNLHSSDSSSNTDQTVEQSEATNNSYSLVSSTNTAESTVQSIATGDSHSTMTPSDTAKSTIKPETADNSSQSTLNIVQSTATSSTTHH